MNSQTSASLLAFFLGKCQQLETLRNFEALADLDKLVAAQLPDAAQLYQRFRYPAHPDDRERILSRVAELAAGARFEDLTPIHGSKGI